MSNLHSKYSLDHEVFNGGRYLEAFSALSDIDHYELAILQYLGNRMPYHQGFVGKVAYPSVGTIARGTKIPQSTVRKKIKQLVTKGYLIKQPRRILNKFGHWQQSSNDYYLTDRAFDIYADVLASENLMKAVGKRVVGQSEPYTPDSPPPIKKKVALVPPEQPPFSEVDTKSPSNSPKESPIKTHSSFEAPSQVDDIAEIVEAWEKVVKIPVSAFEKKRFSVDYLKTESNPVIMLERILDINADPYLLERARSINWLFKGFNAAKMNKVDIKKVGKKALDSVRSKDELASVESELGELAGKGSRNTIDGSDSIVRHLFEKDINTARTRLGVETKLRLPNNINELLEAIKGQLKRTDISPIHRSRFEELDKIVPTTGFSILIDIYSKRLEEVK